LIRTDVLISEELLNKLKNVLPVEDNENRVSFAIALALLMTGDMKMSEVKELTGISELHFDRLMSNIDLPENEFILNAKEYISRVVDASEKEHIEMKPKEVSGSKKYSTVKACEAFELRDGLIHINTKPWNRWFAIKQTVKEHGGRFDPVQKAWKLSDDQLKKWLAYEQEYGWKPE